MNYELKIMHDWLTVTLGPSLRARDPNPDHRQVVVEFPRESLQVGLADVLGVDVGLVAAALQHRIAEVERRVADEVAGQVDADADAAVRIWIEEGKIGSQ